MPRLGNGNGVGSLAQTKLLEIVSSSKNRGAFNTPDVLARFLVNWAIRNPTDSVIDPSVGDGIFLLEAADRILFLGAEEKEIEQLLGVEIDKATAKQCRERLSQRFTVSPKIIGQGFFSTLSTLPRDSFDAVIGNPPFVRYRNFFPDEREIALKFMREHGFTASKLTNAWVPFLVAATTLLKPKGRLAMIMPAELLQVSYASEIREYLLNRFGFILVVAFNHLVFPDVEQEIVLLMGTKGEGRGLRLIEIKDASELSLVPQFRVPQVPVEDSREKWTQYFLSDSQRGTLRKGLALKRLGDYCSVDVGVVTGTNDFFVLRRDSGLSLDADEHLLPIATRTKQMQGIVFQKEDWEKAVKSDPSYLLNIKPALGLSKNLRDYIARGEKNGASEHFKCRMRDPWFIVPSVWVPDAFLFRQIGSYPKLVLNRVGATCTDTLHRVKFKSNRDAGKLVACFHNSLTFAFAEIFGRSYGGGVLELMPTEAEKLPIPVTDSHNLLNDVDGLMRDGLIDEAISHVDERILHEELGYKRADIAIIKSAWQDLSRRRKARHRKKN